MNCPIVVNIVNSLAMISPRYMYRDYSRAYSIIKSKLTSTPCTPNTDAWVFLMWSLAGDLHTEYPAHSIEEWGYILGIRNKITEMVNDKSRVEKFRRHSHRIVRNKVLWLFTGVISGILAICFQYLAIPIIVIAVFLFIRLYNNVADSQRILKNINTYLN